MRLIDKISSKVDKTVKFIFQLKDGLITEAAYINKDDGKDIICVSCQTACPLGCEFCHTTDAIGKIRARNLEATEMIDVVSASHALLELGQNKRMLLISYMGCGEPMCNTWHVLGSMHKLREEYSLIRFAIATLLPSHTWTNFFHLIKMVQTHKFDLKMHLSLHFTDDDIRKEWMPAALPYRTAIAALEFYANLTGNSVEAHYAMIDGVNDSDDNAYALVDALQGRGIPVKLLQYNERKTINHHTTENSRVQRFMDILWDEAIDCEYYVPPGLDVGASCGQFLLDYYLKYNTIGENQNALQSTLCAVDGKFDLGY